MKQLRYYGDYFVEEYRNKVYFLRKYPGHKRLHRGVKSKGMKLLITQSKVYVFILR